MLTRVHRWDALLTLGALEEEGIFRVSAEQSKVGSTRKALRAACGNLDAAHASLAAADGHCIANLMKAYLREIPEDLWAPVRNELHEMLSSTATSVS